MRVVIVGGAGFIGTALARSLTGHGMQALVLDTEARLAKSRAALAGIAIAPFDFTVDRNAQALLTGCDALVHLACTTNPAHSMEGIAWDAESNIAPSLRLFDAAVAAGIRRVVFASSGGTVYGAPRKLPVCETDPTRPLSAYGVSKLAIENYLALYTALEGISLRVANPYGAYQLGGTTVGVIARYVTAVRNDRPIEVWGDGSVVRDYVAIADVVEAFKIALSTQVLEPGSYNIGSGIGTSIRDIIEKVFQVSMQAVPVEYMQGRPYDVPAIILDCGQFTTHTSWAPTTSLHDGIHAMWSLCRSP
jgi:UDP-glucose 4-epimerase